MTNIDEQNREEDIEELKRINKMQERRIQNLEIKALHLTNLYFVFQGVILSTIATKKLYCRQVWIPLTLSLLAIAFNASALFHTVYSFIKCSEALDQSRLDLSSMKDDKKAGLPHDPDRRRPPDGAAQRRRRWLSWSAFVLFLYFSLVMVIGCFSIVCDFY